MFTVIPYYRMIILREHLILFPNLPNFGRNSLIEERTGILSFLPKFGFFLIALIYQKFNFH